MDRKINADHDQSSRPNKRNEHSSSFSITRACNACTGGLRGCAAEDAKEQSDQWAFQRGVHDRLFLKERF
jgi:hypothetical protein